MTSADADAAPVRSFRGSLLARPRWLALVLALLFWWQSLQPTDSPRAPAVQGVVSAVSLAVGYALGSLISNSFHAAMHAWRDSDPTERVSARAWQVLGVATLVIVPLGYVFWISRQNDQRELVGMEHIGITAIPIAFAVTAIIATTLLAIGRLAWFGVRRCLTPSTA